jgi:hypothetical protein
MKKGMQDVVIDYFIQMFNASPNLVNEVINSVHLCVSTSMNNILLVPFQDEEFKRSIFQMGLNKSPCSDGLNLKSYQ